MKEKSFVGFQEKVVVPEGYQLLEITETIESLKSKDSIFRLLATSSGLSQWLVQVQDIDLRQGGKINFTSDEGQSLQAVCTSIVMEREISIIADLFGNFSAKISKSGKGNNLELKFSILTDQIDVQRSRITAMTHRLKALLA